MPFSELIDETEIDKLLESVSDAAQIENLIKSLETEAPKYLAYVFSKDNNLLNVSEQELLTFIVAILWGLTRGGNWQDAELSTDEIAEIEDENWHLLQSSRAKEFRLRLDVFFEDYPQEDLLALVEDLVSVETDEEISKEGREHVFVRCKTFLDILIA